jgi:putative membrane protein
MTRKPAAFDLDEVRYEADDLYPGEDATAVPVRPMGPRRRRPWVAVLLGALGSLIVLGFGLAVDNLVRGLFARNDILGWVALGLAAIAGVSIVALIVREVAALVRLRRIAHVHARAVTAAAADDRAAAMTVVAELTQLYRRRPETARGRKELALHRREIIDGRDLIGLAETQLLVPFDTAAKRLIMGASQRVALVTAISPRAFVDIVFVGAEILRLIRGLATLYGGRPGMLGFFRLAGATVSHLAVTGGMAAGDSLIQQILGHGIAARLSARLGEGVVNGLLTARVGIAAVEVCRPLPFIVGTPPRLADVIAALRSTTKAEGQ